jgi:hypothetical protein
MPNWQSQQWLNTPPKFAPGVDANGPVYALLSPLPGSSYVPANAPIRACAYAASGALDATLTINGVTVLTPSGMHGDYAGFVIDRYSRRFIEVVPRAPFPPGKPVWVHLSVEDLGTAQTTNVYWSFTPIAESDYTGNALLPAESWLLGPCTRFLAVEPLRLWLLENVLDDTRGVPEMRDSVAARAIYQLAYETEISAALSPFTHPDERALATRLPTKRSALELSQLLEGYEASFDVALVQLFSSGAFPREYRNNFTDYFGSLLYNYRVSAVCALVFLARAIEIADITPAGADPASTLLTEDSYVFLMEDGTELEI